MSICVYVYMCICVCVRECVCVYVYIGPLDMECVAIPSEKECFEMLVSEDASEEEIEDTAEYVEEFYGIVEQNEMVMFSYTEEEYDMYVKVKI